MKRALLAAAIACAFPARADWEGALEIRQGKAPAIDGSIKVKGGKVRLEQSIRGHVFLTVFDAPGKRVLQLDPHKRVWTERPMPTPRGPPSCPTSDADGCLRKLGYEKEAGHETIAGHACSIWRRGGTERLWRPDDVAELAFLRQETGPVRVDVRSFRVAAQADGVFAAPPGWTKTLPQKASPVPSRGEPRRAPSR